MLLKGFVIALVSLSLGFLVGSRNAPVAVDSQLAQAQEVTHILYLVSPHMIKLRRTRDDFAEQCGSAPHSFGKPPNCHAANALPRETNALARFCYGNATPCLPCRQGTRM
jgi:hypothetical protein